MDETLIAQAEFKASGANVHDLHNVLSAYRVAGGLLDADKNCPQRLKDTFQRLETKLRAFVYTGILEK